MNEQQSLSLLDTIINCYHRALILDVREGNLGELPGVKNEAKYRNFLHYLMEDLQIPLSVELGTDNGTTACFMGAACTGEQKVITVDIIHRQDTAERLIPYPAVSYWPYSDSTKVHTQFANGSIGLLYMDTDHTLETTTKEKEMYRAKMAPNGIMCVDDIMLHQGMRQFWQNVHRPKFTLNLLHPEHKGSTAHDGTFLPEGTGWGVILPHAQFPAGLSLPQHPLIGGYVIE